MRGGLVAGNSGPRVDLPDPDLYVENAAGMAFGRERGRSHRVANHLGSLLLAHRPSWRIQRSLRIA
jgi:hypothetical protein